MKAMFLALVIIPLLLAGCAEPERTQQRAPGGEAAGERLGPAQGSPTARPVLIGEGGPRFAACQGRGLVGGLRGGELAVRDAPFDGAKQVGAVADGTNLFICTRSLDQQWLGVVVGAAGRVAPADPASAGDTGTALQPATDCGVTSPVRSKRNYDGPCLSGWVESPYVAAVAN